MKRRLILIFVLLQFLTITLYAQSEIGSAAKGGKTWAVVIGISNYKNIPGLNYADRDAQAFYDYLVNTPGGPQLNTSQVKLILNEQALSTEIYAALDWLKESVQKNDQVIFYFSGHGDVEKKTAEQKGFLLAYNSPPAAYSTSGTVDINYLQQYLEAYIKVNKAKNVVLIVDACRSGKLAGGSEGAELTRQVLEKNADNRIIRILSAQENELSLEGTKWGGGRGVFSYYLIKGIEGLANHNNDNVITTAELAAYLPPAVADATGNVQNPEIEGDAQQALFSFSPKLLRQAQLDNVKVKAVNRDLRIGIPDGLTPDVKTNYKSYIDYVRLGRLILGDTLGDSIHCALHFYRRLISNPRALSLRASLQSSFIAALQRKSQELLDDYVKGVDNKIWQSEAYTELLYAKDSIGPEYVLYNYILARIFFLEKESKYPHITINKLKKALQYEADAPYILNQLGVDYGDINILDSAVYYLKKTITVAPQWNVPYNNIGSVYEGLKQTDTAIMYFKKASQLDSIADLPYYNIGFDLDKRGDYNNAIPYYNKAIYLNPKLTMAYYERGMDYQYLNDYDKAFADYKKALEIDSTADYVKSIYSNYGVYYEKQNDSNKAITFFKKAIQIDSTYALAYSNLATVYISLHDYDKACKNLQKAIALDTLDGLPYFNLGTVYQALQNYDKAINCYNKAIQLDTAIARAGGLYNLGLVYQTIGNYAQAILNYQKELNLNNNDIPTYYNLACVYSIKNNKNKSLDYLKQSLDKGFKDYAQIQKDDDLSNLRKTRGFRVMMKQYFTDKAK